MRSVGHWQRVFRAWAALVLVSAHLLLVLSTSVTQAALSSIAHGVDGVICLPGGSSGALDGPADPASDHRGDCCVSCAAPGAFAVPTPAFDVALIDLIAVGAADSCYVAQSDCNLIENLPGSPRAPPDIA
jgi:hypothetical protein